jgi:hypothetical protein
MCTVCLIKVNEGWNRLAHESILIGTPVFGYGNGGLGGGSQGHSRQSSATANGTENTGGGTGGAGGTSGTTNISGNGGSGVVILRTSDAVPTASSYTGTLFTTGGFKYYKFTGTGSITF